MTQWTATDQQLVT